MRRLITAAAFGLGLLSAGIMAGSAAAAPLHGGTGYAPRVAAEPVHFDRHQHRHGYQRPHYAPPRHYGRHYGRHHGPRHGERQHAPYRYGYRY